MSDQTNGDAEAHRTPKQRSEGGQMRDRLERSIAENRRLREAVVEMATSGRKHVTAADFADLVSNDAWAELDVSALHARADELEQLRAESSRNVLRNALLDAGVTEEGVEDALARLVAGPGAMSVAPDIAPAETPQSRTASLGELGGRPAKLGGADYHELLREDRGLWGADLIQAAIQREGR